MKCIKKTVALVLFAVMVFGLIGCSVPPIPDSSGDSTPNTDPSNAPGIALKPEKPVLKILLQSSSDDPNTKVEALDITKVTGYQCVYSALPSQNATETLMLEVSSGTEQDLIFTRANQFYTLMSSGALTPINDYVNAIAPELWDCVTKPAWSGVTAADGLVYGLPATFPYDTEVATFIVCRMDLLEQAGVKDIPKTLDDFTEMLYKLKDFYGEEYIILTGPYNRNIVGASYNIPLNVSSAFGIYNDWMVDKNGKVIYMTEHENYQNMMDYFTKLYNDGILDPDYAINTYNSVDEKLSSGKAILTIHNRDSLSAALAALEKDLGIPLDRIGWIGALSGADGTCTVMKTQQYDYIPVIPKSSDNAADVINFLRLKVENQEYLVIGEEGVHFELDEYKNPIPIQPAFNDERNLGHAFKGFVDTNLYKNQWLVRVRKSNAQWAVFNEVTIKENRERPEIFVDAYFAFTDDPAFHKYNTALRENLNDYFLQLIMGSKTIEGSLSQFMSNWSVNGGEEVREGLQKFYDNNYK
jgi:putative aldouronate transport system substrate-binding protein